jgi:hypothetical protein
MRPRKSKHATRGIERAKYTKSTWDTRKIKAK